MIYNLKINGMSCNHCKKNVEKTLSSMEGVKSVIVSLEEKSAVLETEKEHSREVLFEMLDDAGYELVEMSVKN